MVQIHPDPPFSASRTKPAPHVLAHATAPPSSDLRKISISCGSCAAWKLKLSEKGNRNLKILHEVLTRDIIRGAIYSVYEASARRFFSLARRGFCVRREHTRWYVTKRAKNATRLEEKRSSTGAIAQLGERLPCTQEVGGSIPPSSTICPA